MEFIGKRVLVLGLGESGLAMAKWLSGQGASLRVADSRTEPPNAKTLANLLPQAQLVTGEFKDTLLENIDILAISPGISAQIPLLERARTRNIPVVSEIDLFALGIKKVTPRAKVIAITGSNGKTTTTSLVAHLLNGINIPAVACGNISPSALDALMDAMEEAKTGDALPSVWVLELSSFQIETTTQLYPDAATILNISEDHLDRHQDLPTYAAIKARIFNGNGVRVLNREDSFSMASGKNYPKTVTFGITTPSPNDADYSLIQGQLMKGKTALFAQNALGITGAHNAANALAALALCEAIGVPPEKLLPALASFKGLSHRVEFVSKINEVSYFDDSKGTNVGATLAAIEGLGCKIAVILGGEGKDQDFSPLKDSLAKHARAVALIGRDAKIIAKMIDGCNVPMHFAEDLPLAVRWCAKQTKAGDAVLLSPACASFDMFKNYAHRAEVFVNTVRELEREAT